MTIDEFYCHQRRPLRRWERVGHPLDTLMYSACFGFLWWAKPSATTLSVYGGLVLASCALIAKDEWQHGELCDGFENWLHAWLFMLHPVVLIWTGYLWWQFDSALALVLSVTLTMTLGFLLFQIFYWNWWRRDQQ